MKKMKLFYDRPANKWEEALPVGNGRLGAMALMAPEREVVFLNEDSIWSGRPINRINPDAKENLPEVRRLLREGKIREAEKLSLLALSGTPNSERNYEPAGELQISFEGQKNAGAGIFGGFKPSNYRRELDLTTGITSAEYVIGGKKYCRKLFASFPEQVIVMRLETEASQGISCSMRFERSHNKLDEVYGKGSEIGFRVVNEGGISFAVKMRVKAEGGTVRTIGEHLLIEGAKRADMFLAIETSFRHEDYEKAAADRLDRAAALGYETIAKEQLKDYAEHLNTMELELSDGKDDKAAELPVDKRLERLRRGKKDPSLFALYFMYGRYLLFSSSRGDSLPANLQGIWNNSMTPPWDSKFTININTEMNYWPAEKSGLSECHLPLFAFLDRVCENGKRTAREMYGCRGSVAHHNSDVFADTAPQDHYIPASFWPMGEAFLATHIWEHYSYTGDKEFLRRSLYVLEECVDFFADFLIEDEEGHLVTSPSVSPENTYIMEDGSRGCMCEGPAIDTQILTELLTGYLRSLEALGKEESESADSEGETGAEGKVAAEGEPASRKAVAEDILRRLPKMGIGRHGQLLEWRKDYDEPEPGHRHISHLYGVYPGTSISYEKDRQLMEAAKTSLKRRLANGGGHTGWSRAWIIGLWARFLEKDKVYENLEALLTQSTFDNLMDNHPYGPGHCFQIDGNFGAIAAMLEMLVQEDEEGNVKLLPALPSEFKNGSVSGIRLKGGRSLSMKWVNGEVVESSISGRAF